MKKVIALIAATLTLVVPFEIFAQTPASATINLNNITATIHADGRIFQDTEQGGFVVSNEEGTTSSLLNGTGLWIAGISSQGELHGAIQAHNIDGKTDFIPTPGLNKIWKITREQVEAHKADFADNGIIDDPIPAIFSWPGRENPYFQEYNNADLYLSDEFNEGGYADYWDVDGDGNYFPSLGDYPKMRIRGCYEETIPTPDELYWFSYTDATPHTQSGLAPLGVIIQCQIAVYNCQENIAYNNSMYVTYTLFNGFDQDLESTYLGLFSDFTIGDSEDDFIGIIPSKNMQFAYNGNEVDEIFGSDIPVIGVDILRNPLKQLNDELLEQTLASHQSIGAIDDHSGQSYYHLLQGLEPDGTVNNNQTIAFPDNPIIQNGNSELGLGNAPGERIALSTFGPYTMLQGDIQEIVIAYTFESNSEQSPAENILSLEQSNDEVQMLFDNCFETMPEWSDIWCTSATVSTREIQNLDINIFPNPTTYKISIQSKEVEIASLQIINGSGQTVFQQSKIGFDVDIHMSQFPNGIYHLYLTTTSGESLQKKVVVF